MSDSISRLIEAAPRYYAAVNKLFAAARGSQAEVEARLDLEAAHAFAKGEIPARRPLDPVPGLRLLSREELRSIDPAQELHDALATGGHPVPIDVIRGWSPDRFFTAMRYARACRDRLSGAVDDPEKPEWIP